MDTCVSSIFSNPKYYNLIHKFLDNSIEEFLKYNKLKNPDLRTQCDMHDAWATSCGVSSFILKDLLFINNSFGSKGVSVCPNSIQLYYSKFGALQIEFYLQPQSCPAKYLIKVNGDQEQGKLVCASLLSKMIKNIVSLKRVTRVPKSQDLCACQPIEYVLLDLESRVFYSTNSIFPICKPLLIISNEKNLEMSFDDNYLYRIPRSYAILPEFLELFLAIPESSLYFSTVKVSEKSKGRTNSDRPIGNSENYFIVKRLLNDNLGFFVSSPLTIPNYPLSTISYDRPSIEVCNIEISPDAFSIEASSVEDPSIDITVAFPHKKTFSRLLAFLDQEVSL